VKDNLLSVELFVNENVQVVHIFLNVDWHVDATTSNHDWDWLSVVLVFQEQSELLFDVSQFVRDKGELNAGA
jgi:hypothetical protein